MRKIALIFMALALLSSCKKEKIVSEPCTFDLKINWVKGTKVQFTVTPGDHITASVPRSPVVLALRL